MTRPLCCRGLLACAKICCSLMTNNGIIAKRSFHRIWISNKNRYWNGPQAQAVCNVKLSTFIIRSRPKLNYGAGRNFGVGPQFTATRKQPIIPRNSRARLCAGEEDRVTWLWSWLLHCIVFSLVYSCSRVLFLFLGLLFFPSSVGKTY